MEDLEESLFALFRDEDHLPFTDEDARECLTHPPAPMRDPDAVNVVTAETLRNLRLNQCWTLPSLDRFPSMHMDIICEVLSHLHPLDIVHFIPHKQGLQSTSALSKHRQDLAQVFFALARLSSALSALNLWAALDESGFWAATLRDLSPSTRTAHLPPAHGGSVPDDFPLQCCEQHPSRLCLHIFDANDAIMEVQAAVQRGETVPFLENWFLERKAMVIANQQAAKTAISWWDAAAQKRRQRFSKQFNPNTAWVITLKTTSERASQLLIPRVEKQRTQRLFEEREYLLASRRRVITAAASQILRTSPPQLWPHLPPPGILYDWSPLKSLIDDPSHRPLAGADAKLLDALVDLPELVIAWRAAQRETTLSHHPAG
ncbi:hypothetical protein MKEN_00002000 [Mycena kentingensis (nom. inval.)]|nr:hypothetical protein MKEN_00002000 [Mycena kentingensis (nom. inval.)]